MLKAAEGLCCTKLMLQAGSFKSHLASAEAAELFTQEEAMKCR